MSDKSISAFGITYIDGDPYLLTLPHGGTSREQASKSEFGRMVELIGEETFHCQMGTLCSNWANHKCFDPEEGCYWSEAGYVCQYDGTQENWSTQDYRSYGVGFRPVLIPLNPETLQPDPTIFAGVEDGTVIGMGSLYVGDEVQFNPDEPTKCPNDFTYPPHGDVPIYTKGASIRICDTSRYPVERIKFVKCGDRLVSDRVILGCVKMDDLKQNLVVEPIRKAPEQEQANAPQGPVNLWARLGITLTVSTEELDILRRSDDAAKDLFVKLVQSDRCKMDGDTYFPVEANEEYLTEEVGFDLYPQSLQVKPLQHGGPEKSEVPSLESRLADAQARSNGADKAAENSQQKSDH